MLRGESRRESNSWLVEVIEEFDAPNIAHTPDVLSIVCSLHTSIVLRHDTETFLLAGEYNPPGNIESTVEILQNVG